MTLTVSAEDVDGVTVLVFDGVADDQLIVEMVPGIEAVADDEEHIVLDLDDLWLIDVAALRAFMARLLESSAAGRVAFACGRLSGRRILRRWAGDDVPVYTTAADAAAACRDDLPGGAARGRS